ncbi:MAG: hypothetical protein A3H98_07795 [Bacteroidetes bacterium RIFCSPLOWO2_02_FULL_36_8]|nr:MAG: hypothetical protein A3H98_07795 [Bacteroidetes bacterium RIFCSPLOWO2_02_FULL_36_8]OFY69011.1 MAG: hypothetical protein A3G23_13090 [Bacteroidetes bacterium RIFCSPLOWO2_12_FULL_37_12]
MNLRFLVIVLSVFCVPTHGQTFKQLLDSAQYHSKKFNIQVALQFGEKALKQAEIQFGKNDTNYANALSVLFFTYFRAANYEKAISYIKDELSIRKNVTGEKSVGYSVTLNNLSGLYYNMGSYPEAEELYLQSIAIKKNVIGENHSDYARALSNLGLLYYITGRYQLAEELYLKAIKINKALSTDHFSTNPIYLQNLASLYETTGRYPEAEELFLQSIALHKSQDGEKRAEYAMVINNLAGLYQSLGRFRSAEELYVQAMNIKKNLFGENHPSFANSLNGLGLFYMNTQRYSSAEKLYLQSSEIIKIRLGENHPNYASVLNNLAYLYYVVVRYSKSEEMFLKSIQLKTTQNVEDHPDNAPPMNNLAELYKSMGRYALAENYFFRSMAIRKAQLGEKHPLYANSLFNLAMLYEKMGKYTEANSFFQQALDKNLYQVRNYFPSMSEKEKGQFYNTLKNNFEHYYSFIAKYTINSSLNDADSVLEKILNYRLSTKGLMFNSGNKIRENIFKSRDTSLIKLFNTWKNKREYLAKLFTLSKEELDNQKISIPNHEKELNDLEKELSKKSELFNSKEDKYEIDRHDIQQKLKEGEAFVEIIRFRKYGTVTDTIHFNDSISYLMKNGFTDSINYGVLILTALKKQNSKSQNLRFITLQNGNELEGKYFNGYKLSIKHNQPYPEGFEFYWAKIAKELQGIRTVYFSADGVYNQLNLNTLQNPASGNYLLEEINIRMITSGKDIMNQNKIVNNKENSTASIYGNINYENHTAESDFGKLPELPGTKSELLYIDSLLKINKWQTKLFQQNFAVESALKQEKSPGILHIATHGYFLTEKNIRGVKYLGIDSIYFTTNTLLKSGLLMAMDSAFKENEIVNSENNSYPKREDGILTAFEAMNLNLDNTELVVLSACESGLGNVEYGEGVYGLQRAFQQAGAKAVLMSLWKISDEHTQELMSGFYTNWLTGMDKVSALKKVQIDMKMKNLSPYYWGAFVIVGN